MAVKLYVNCLFSMNVKLVDGIEPASLGLAHGVQVTFAPGVVEQWDFWVVPLAMDAILGDPGLRVV